MSLFFKKPTFVGLSVHDDEIRLIKLKLIKQQITVDDVGIIALPAGLLADGKINNVLEVSRLIKQLVVTTGTKNCPVAIALPISQLIHKRITLPTSLTPEEQQVEIVENLASYLPGIQAELQCDYVRLGALDATRDDILLVAARTDQVCNYVAAVQQAGLHVTVVDADIYALSRTLSLLAKGISHMALVDVDVNSLQMVVWQDKKMVFHQRLQFQAQLSQLQGVTQALHLLMTAVHFPSIEKIYLSGKSTSLLMIKQQIQLELGITLDVFQLDEQIEWRVSSQPASLLLTTFGLAMRASYVGN